MVNLANMRKYDQQQKEKIIKRLVFDNPWWATGKIAEDYDSMPRRPYYETLSSEVGIKKDTIKKYLEYLEAALLSLYANH